MMHSGDHRYAGWRTAISHFSRNRRVQSAGIDNEPWFGIWYSIIVGRFPSEIEMTGKRPAKRRARYVKNERRTERTERRG